MRSGCAANRAAKLKEAATIQSTSNTPNTSEIPRTSSQATECPGCPLTDLRQIADKAVGSAQATASATPTTRTIQAGPNKIQAPPLLLEDSFERIKRDLGAFNLKRYVPSAKKQQEEEQKSPSSVQFAQTPASDGFEVLHDKSKSLQKKGTSKFQYENITPCPSFSPGSQFQTQWQQQRQQMPAFQQNPPNVSYVQCPQKIIQSAQRSKPQQQWSRAYDQQYPTETLYTPTRERQQVTPREAFNTAFIGQLPNDSDWSPTANQKAPRPPCLLHGAATPRDVFNQGFVSQQRPAKRYAKSSATPREAFDTGFVGQLPTDDQWRSQTPAPQPPRDVFNEAFIGQLPLDNQARPQVVYRRPPTPRDVFNEAFIGQLPTDSTQALSGTMTPAFFDPRDVVNQGYMSSDDQWGSRVNRFQIRPARDMAPPSTGRDVFNEAFVGQLPTDRQPQPPTSRDPFNEAFIDQLPTDYQSRNQLPYGRMPQSFPTPRDPFNEAFIGQLPSDNQSRNRPPCLEKSRWSPTPREAFNEAFIGQLPSDNQGRFATRRDVFNEGFRGQLPSDSQWNTQPISGRKTVPPSTPRYVFDQGFRGQLPADQWSPPGASKRTNQGGYRRAETRQLNPRQRPCGRC